MKLTISNLQKRKINQKALKTLAGEILRHEKIKSGFISVVLVDDRLILKLNRQFLSRNLPTDVLAFDLAPRKSRGKLYGEIIISTDTAKRNAAVFHTGLHYEVSLYLTHAILHLLGFDDSSPKKSRIMRSKEAELMRLFSR